MKPNEALRMLTTTAGGRILTLPQDAAGALPLLPPREERAGERRAVWLQNRPSPQPSPRSCVAGRGRNRGQCQHALTAGAHSAPDWLYG